MSDEAKPHDCKDACDWDRMQQIASLVDEELPDGWGFALMAFPLNKPGWVNYVGNGKRTDIIRCIRALRAFIKRSEVHGTDESFFKHHKK